MNVDNISPLSRVASDFKGSCGQVYTLSFLGKAIAVKSYRIKPMENIKQSKIMKRIVKEYCITRICHELGSEPSVYNSLGFDLLVFNHQI